MQMSAAAQGQSARMIHDSIGRLEKRAESLRATTDALSERLATVLPPPPPTAVENRKDAPAPPTSHVRGKLDDCETVFASVDETLRYLIDRLEI